MIIIGCLSIITGVSVAYLHHRNTSSDVPAWLGKLLWRCKVSSTHRRTKAEDCDEIQDNDERRKEYISHNAINDSHQQEEEVYSSINDEGRYGRDGHGYSWVEVAALLDRCMMITCLTLTLLSLIVTAALFVARRY